MKTPFRIYWLLTFSVFILSAKIAPVTAQTTKTTGIQFLDGDFKKILSTAKAAKKHVFVEVHLKGCPHCEALAPVLEEKEVGTFFNTHFVSWKIEANSAESSAFQKEKGVTYPEFPLFFFFDSSGNLLHMATPADKSTREEFSKEVIMQGKTALNPEERTSGYAGRFQNGNRDIMFLISYGKYAKAIKDTASLHSINRELGKQLIKPQDITSSTGFYVLQRLINDFDNPLSVYFFSHLNDFTSRYPAKDVKDAGEAIIYHSLYGAGGDSHPYSKIVEMRKAMVQLGVPATEASARTLLKELGALFRVGNTKNAIAVFNHYREQAPALGGADYAYLMKFFNEKSTDPSYLTEMPIWAASGLKASKPADQASRITANIYYELAEAYFKMGKKSEALANSQKALQNAKLAKIDIQPFEKQLNSLK